MLRHRLPPRHQQTVRRRQRAEIGDRRLPERVHLRERERRLAVETHQRRQVRRLDVGVRFVDALQLLRQVQLALLQKCLHLQQVAQRGTRQRNRRQQLLPVLSHHRLLKHRQRAFQDRGDDRDVCIAQHRQEGLHADLTQPPLRFVQCKHLLRALLRNLFASLALLLQETRRAEDRQNTKNASKELFALLHLLHIALHLARIEQDAKHLLGSHLIKELQAATPR